METRSVYMGPNSVTRFYRLERKFNIKIMCFAYGVLAVFFLIFKMTTMPDVSTRELLTEPSDYLIAAAFSVPLAYFIVYVIYTFAQEKYYNNVILSDVQKVVPRTGTPGGMRLYYYNLEFEVVKDGQKKTVTSQRVFDAYRNRISDYTGEPQMAGYDSKRKHWIVI